MRIINVALPDQYPKDVASQNRDVYCEIRPRDRQGCRSEDGQTKTYNADELAPAPCFHNFKAKGGKNGSRDQRHSSRRCARLGKQGSAEGDASNKGPAPVRAKQLASQEEVDSRAAE